VIAVAGSVAVGKSTTARLLCELLRRWPQHPRVSLVTTDGFLLPNAELARQGLLERKGFPESYDLRALLRFVIDVKSGVETVTAPVYSHLAYDVTDEHVSIEQPDIVILEGLTVLQPARVRGDGRPGLAVSDFFDFSVYVDAAASDIRAWYVRRFLRLRETAFRDPRSYFARYAALSTDEATQQAEQLWDAINGRTCGRTSRRPVAGPRWCCARTPTTRCAASVCASSSRPAAAVPRATAGRRAVRPRHPAGESCCIRVARTAPMSIDPWRARDVDAASSESSDAQPGTGPCHSPMRSTERKPMASLTADIGGLSSALKVCSSVRSGCPACIRERLATFRASPSRCPRCRGSTSVSHWYARPGSVPATTTVVCATSSPSGPTAAVV
jgi:pantothenate kinase